MKSMLRWFLGLNEYVAKQELRMRSRKHCASSAQKARLSLEFLEVRTLLAYTAAFVGGDVTFTGDGSSDSFTLDLDGSGNLQHNRFTAGDPGFESDIDLDSASVGVQSLAIGSVTAVTVNAGAGDDTITIGSAASQANTLTAPITIDGESDADTMVIDDSATPGNSANTWNIPVPDAGTVAGGVAVTFGEIENLTGGAIDDSFVLADGVGLTGSINGAGGNDSLDYGSYTTAIAVNLQTGAATGLGGTATNIDLLSGGTASDLLTGADAANTWNITANDLGNIGGSFSFSSIENLTGGTLADEFVFGDGVGVTGAINGEVGTDTLNYSAYTTGVAVDLQAGTATGTAGISNIENATGGSGADSLAGDGNNNSLNGGPGNDSLAGRAGDDVLNGGADTDTLAEVVTGNVTITDAGITGFGADTLISIEQFTFTGDAGNNRMDASGFSGGVSFDGGAGNDTLIGGLGNDTLSGGAGNDLINGGPGLDTLSFAAAPNGVQVNLKRRKATGDGRDSVRNMENVVGSAFDDSILGHDGANHINGGLGNDLVSGQQGDDTVDGGTGNDTVNGGIGNDVLLGSAGNDELTGDFGRDLLIGGLDSDTLMGKIFDDILVAGTTAHDANNAALAAILAEWSNLDRLYAVRVANIRDGSGSPDRLNGAFFLSVATVFDDAAADTLLGGKDMDWFFAHLGGGTVDTIVNRLGAEITDLIF